MFLENSKRSSEPPSTRRHLACMPRWSVSRRLGKLHSASSTTRA